MTLTFEYSGGEGHTVTIQWYHDGEALVDGDGVSGATTTTLTVPDTAEYDGSYYAIVTDEDVPDCVVQTSTLEVEVPDVCRLVITEQPDNASVDAGGEISLTVAYEGNVGPVTFQWLHDGTPLVDGTYGAATISGATTDTLTITGITEALAGDYSVVLTDSGLLDCTATSNNAEVEVAPVEPPADMYIWYDASQETVFSNDEKIGDGIVYDPPIHDWSGNNLDITLDAAGVGAQGPIYKTNQLNGLPVFEYPGPIGTGTDLGSGQSPMYSLGGIGWPIASTGITLALVCRRDNENALYDPLTLTGLDGSVAVRARIFSSASPTEVTYSARGFSTSTSVTAPLESWQILTFTFDFVEGIPRLKANNSESAGAVGAGTPSLTITQLQMCAVGAIAECLAYNTKLDDAGVAQLRTYLSQKWAIAITV